MDDKIEYYKVSMYRRFGVSFVDLCFLVFLFIVTMLCYSNLFLVRQMNNDEAYINSLSKMNEILIDNNICRKVYTKEGAEIEVIFDDSNFVGVYTSFDSLDVYNNLKKESNLFNEDYTLKENVSNEELEKFYYNAYMVVINILKENNSEYVNYENIYIERKKVYEQKMLLYPLVFSFILLYIVIPLFTKNGKTLGKMIFNIAISTNNYQDPNKLQIFIRQFIFIFELVLVFPILISFAISMFEKEGKTIHDYLGATIAIDKRDLMMLRKRKKENESELSF